MIIDHKKISHRGNLIGPSDYENNPNQIAAVLKMGYDCEIDFWFVNNKYYLGHDKPSFEIKRSFLKQKGLWIHCKNLEALEKVPQSSNYFWHQNDDFTLTSKRYIWTFPKKNTGKKSVIVDNNSNWKEKEYDCFAVCTDYIL
jgi:hypothetical protein